MKADACHCKNENCRPTGSSQTTAFPQTHRHALMICSMRKPGHCPDKSTRGAGVSVRLEVIESPLEVQARQSSAAVRDEEVVSRVHGRRRHRSSLYEPAKLPINSITENNVGINAAARIRIPYRKARNVSFIVTSLVTTTYERHRSLPEPVGDQSCLPQSAHGTEGGNSRLE